MWRLVLQTLVFTAIAPGALVILVPALINRASGGTLVAGALLAPGIAIAALGLGIFLWCVFDFITSGHGTPAPYEPPRELVVQGLYRFVRNPMYWGVCTMIFAQAALFASHWLAVYGAVVLLGFHARVIYYEEPTLARLFGASWEQYRRRVPRWLPRLRPGRRGEASGVNTLRT